MSADFIVFLLIVGALGVFFWYLWSKSSSSSSGGSSASDAATGTADSIFSDLNSALNSGFIGFGLGGGS